MQNKFDKIIIRDFRKTVTGNNSFVRHHFTEYPQLKDNNKKNLWSKICACMDWIDVSITGLQEYPSFNTKDINKGALEFAQFILTIDMVSEAIKNLWMTFSLAEDINNYPFKDDKKIFNGVIWGKSVDDDTYFKHLRAFFGMHSVNGNEVNVPIDGEQIKVRFFSSWSTSRDGENFSLTIYSNNKQAEKKYGGILLIKVEELLSYASMRYQSLSELSKEIKLFYSKTIANIRSENQISLCKESSALEKMIALKEFAAKTIYFKDYYSQYIDWYIKILQVSLDKYSSEDKQIIKSFLKVLENKIIPAYQKALNDFVYTESPDIELISINPKNYHKYIYEYTKVLTFLEYLPNDLELDSYISAKHSKEISLNYLIEENELPAYSKKLSNEELYLLIHAKAYDTLERV